LITVYLHVFCHACFSLFLFHPRLIVRFCYNYSHDNDITTLTCSHTCSTFYAVHRKRAADDTQPDSTDEAKKRKTATESSSYKLKDFSAWWSRHPQLLPVLPGWRCGGGGLPWTGTGARSFEFDDDDNGHELVGLTILGVCQGLVKKVVIQAWSC